MKFQDNYNMKIENMEDLILTSCASKNINQKTRCLIQAKGC